MKNRLVFFLFVFIAIKSNSQESFMGVFIDYGLNLPITNKSDLRLPFNISTGFSYHYIKPRSIMAFVPELYVERTLNQFKIFDKTSLDNELYRLSINIGSSMQINKKASLTIKLSLKYLFRNQMLVNTDNTYYSSTLNFVGLDYNSKSTNLIPGIGFSFRYVIIKKLSVSLNFHQALISNYKEDLIYVYDNLQQKSVNFNLKESKISLTLTYSLKKDKKYHSRR